jgi:hypothetical protein
MAQTVSWRPAGLASSTQGSGAPYDAPRIAERAPPAEGERGSEDEREGEDLLLHQGGEPEEDT